MLLHPHTQKPAPRYSKLPVPKLTPLAALRPLGTPFHPLGRLLLLICRSFPCFPPTPVLVAPFKPLCLSTAATRAQCQDHPLHKAHRIRPASLLQVCVQEVLPAPSALRRDAAGRVAHEVALAASVSAACVPGMHACMHGTAYAWRGTCMVPQPYLLAALGA